MRARILADRSAIADRSGEPDVAEDLAAEALALAESGADPAGIGRSLDLLGILARRRGDLATAHRHLERAIALTVEALGRCERQGDRHRQAALENNLADLLHATGRAGEAMDHLKRAVALFAEIGGRPGALDPEIWKLVEW